MNDSDCCPPKRNGKAYDVIVVGAGSAGFSAAITAAELGAQVALIGGGTMGGTCVNVGCVPSKALIRAVEPLHQANSATRFAGIRATARVEDWQATVRQKNDLVTNLRQSKYADLLPAYNGIAYREGTASLVEFTWRACFSRQNHHRYGQSSSDSRHSWH
jgi:mercuric reductase